MKYWKVAIPTLAFSTMAQFGMASSASTLTKLPNYGGGSMSWRRSATTVSARWQCAGDCQIRWYDEVTAEFDDRADFRCELNRAMIKHELQNWLAQPDKVAQHVPVMDSAATCRHHLALPSIIW